MSAQPIGIVEGLQERRESLVSRLSPAAKHQAFPTMYARPLPMPAEAAPLRAELLRLEKLLSAARSEIISLKERNHQQAEELTQYINAEKRSHILPVVPRVPSAPNVIRQFLVEYNALAILEGREGLHLADLTGPRRSMFCAQPRQVAMWLCHGICRSASLPMIGKAFGGKDHTTVLHAKRRAPRVMERRPDLVVVAERVLAHFDSAGVSQ